MNTIKITKSVCQNYKFLNVPNLVNPLVLQLTEVIWNQFEQTTESELKFSLDFNKKEVYHKGEYKIEKIETGSSYVNFVCKELKFNGKQGLAHELSHVVHKHDFPTDLLQCRIKKYCIENEIKDNKIIRYLKNSKELNEKLIAYLYLVENDELIAKFTGFVSVNSNGELEYNHSEFSKGVYRIYKEIIKVEFTEDDFKDFIKYLNELNVSPHLIKYLNDKECKGLIEYMQNQSKKFTDAYEHYFFPPII